MSSPDNVSSSPPKNDNHVSATSRGESEISIARRRIEKALSPTEVADVEALARGLSGAHVYRVTTVQDRQYFAKIVLSWSDIGWPAWVRSEHAQSAWAAARNLGPAVIFSDVEQGTLITEFLVNEMESKQQVGQEPWLSATLATIRALHSQGQPVENTRYQREKAVSYWKEAYDKLTLEERQLPFVQAAERVTKTCIHRLSGQTFNAVTLHGDLNGGNVIYSSGKSWLVDWGGSTCGDAMEDLAYFAYHADFGLNEFEFTLQKYDPSLTRKDMERAKCHLALLHAHWYLETRCGQGLAWESREWYEARVPILESFLAEDRDWLGLQKGMSLKGVGSIKPCCGVGQELDRTVIVSRDLRR